MIQKTELRVGNYISDRGGKMWQIDSWETPNKVSAKSPYCGEMAGIPIYGHPYTEELEYLRPILLTTEILGKCGAEAKGVMGTTEIHWKIGNYLISQSEIDRMGSLHFLQNWYYFKTFGEELTVNL